MKTQIKRYGGRIVYKSKPTEFRLPDRITTAGVFGSSADSQIVGEICRQSYTSDGTTVLDALYYLNRYRAPSEQADEMWAVLQAAREDYDAIKAKQEADTKKGGTETMKHQTFGGYIDDLNEVTAASLDAYKKLCDAHDAARADYSETEGMSEIDRMIARGRIAEADKAFESGLANLREETDGRINEVRAAMQTHLNEFYRATPDKLDTKALELLKSGIMSGDEIESLANRYHGNPTMLRMIGSLAMNSEDKKTHAIGTALSGMKDGKTEMDIFERACVPTEYFIRQEREISERMVPELGRGYTAAKDALNSLYAKPEAEE